RLKPGGVHGGAEQQLLSLLDGWRGRSHADQGSGPGNAINLLRLVRGDLRNLDLAGLAIRQAYLAGVEMQHASLAGAHLSEAALAEAFSFPTSLALNRDDATLLAAGTSAGEVWLWRVADRTPLLAIQAHAGPVWGVALTADGQRLVSASENG